MGRSAEEGEQIGGRTSVARHRRAQRASVAKALEDERAEAVSICGRVGQVCARVIWKKNSRITRHVPSPDRSAPCQHDPLELGHVRHPLLTL